MGGAQDFLKQFFSLKLREFFGIVEAFWNAVGIKNDCGSDDWSGQWSAPGAQMDDVRGMYVTDGAANKKKTKRKADTLYWMTPSGVYSAVLDLP